MHRLVCLDARITHVGLTWYETIQSFLARVNNAITIRAFLCIKQFIILKKCNHSHFDRLCVVLELQYERKILGANSVKTATLFFD